MVFPERLRIGQKQDVNIYIPILHHPELESFDANLHRLLSKKTLLKDAVVTPEQVVPTPAGVGAEVLTHDHRITPEDLVRISWEQFESLCAVLMSQHLDATNCWLTKSGADYGADAVITTGTAGFLIQSKHTKNASYDGYKAIQEVHGAKVKYENAMNRSFQNLILMTNARQLSAKTRKIADEYGVQIISHDEICAMLEAKSISFSQVLDCLGKKRIDVS